MTENENQDIVVGSTPSNSPIENMTFSVDKSNEAPVDVLDFKPQPNVEDVIVTEPIVEEVIVPVELEVEEVVTPVEENEYIELDEATAFKFLKEKHGLQFENIDELLTPKEQKKLAPTVAKFQEFVEATGNESFDDFIATQKDWNSETPESVLRQLIKTENPMLSKKEIDFLYDEKYDVQDLDEDLDDKEILKKGINAKIDLQKAISLFEKQKEQYMVVRGTDEGVPEEYKNAKITLEQIAKQQESNQAFFAEESSKYKSHVESTYNENFEGLKVKLGNKEIGFEEVFIKPEDMKAAKDYVSSIDNFNKRFYDDKGVLIDPKGFTDALLKEKNYDRDLNIAYNRGYAKKAEDDDKLSKNIQPENIRNVPQNTSTGISYSIEKN